MDKRRQLWKDIVELNLNISEPWVVQGDFNALLTSSEKSGGSMDDGGSSTEFARCVAESRLVELTSSGNFYTWTNNQSGENRIWCKLDRVLVNQIWESRWPLSMYRCLNSGVSDHSPLLVLPGDPAARKVIPFKFFNAWISHPEFQDILRKSWESSITGSPMYILWSKLKVLKRHLGELKRKAFSNMHDRICRKKNELEALQTHLQSDTMNGGLHEQEQQCRHELLSLLRDEESMMRQKSRATWLKEGDSNSKFFHARFRTRNMVNGVKSLKINQQICTNQEVIKTAMVDYYQGIFGCEEKTSRAVEVDILESGCLVSEEDSLALTASIKDEEIKEALWSIGNDKAPGIDGFNSFFFKSNWSVVGLDFLRAVHGFFTSSRMLKQFNSTILTVIPKIESPEELHDFRPISCCTTVYKTVTKVMANRLKLVLQRIISHSQTAFIPGRKIVDNIMLAHDLVRGYHIKSGGSNCLFKTDIRKAYDSLSWEFLEQVLYGLRFPSQFITWLMACYRNSWFSVAVNGGLEGFFAGKRGLRQGDPMSPLLFTVAMKYFSRLLSKTPSSFKYHKQCEGLKLNHLCFADDLMLFCKGDIDSIRFFLSSLQHLREVSGLEVNKQKSEVFFSNIAEHVQEAIIGECGYKIGILPVRYLGVPLITSRLKKSDCRTLIDKILQRINHWSSHMLSFSGRLQLINSVLRSVSVYWCSIFTIPMSVIKEIEKMTRAFLWKGGLERKGRHKVAWEEVCKPKREGGLNVWDLARWNKAAMIKHIWSLLIGKSSLWARWIHEVKLRRMSFWGLIKRPKDCWIWNSLLNLRELAKKMFIYTLGAGTISFWFDPWVDGQSLHDMFPELVIANTPIRPHARVCDVWSRGAWNLPYSTDPITREAWSKVRQYSIVEQQLDSVKWRGGGKFCISTVYDDIRIKSEKVS